MSQPGALEHAVRFLEILDHMQLMAVDPPGEYHEKQLEFAAARSRECSTHAQSPSQDSSSHGSVTNPHPAKRISRAGLAVLAVWGTARLWARPFFPGYRTS